MAPKHESGQASIEQLGLVLLVALVLLAAGAISAIAAPGLRNRVTTAFQRSLCTVAGQACPTLEREPCPVLRTDRTLATRITVGWLRLGDDRALAIERRSDGGYVINLVEGVGAGAGGVATRGGLAASADALLSARAGRSWRVADREAAVRLVQRLRRRALPGAETLVRGAADLAGLADAEQGVDAYVVSGRGAVSAAATLGLGSIVEGGAEADGGVEVGLRIAARRREATAYISVDGRVGAFFDALPAASLPHDTPRRRGTDRHPDDDSTSSEQARDAESTLLNPDKLSQDVSAVSSGTVALRLAPGPRVIGVEITAVVGTGAAQRELRARIDPQQPEVAAALAAWRRDPTSSERLAALARAGAAGAAVDDRRYAVVATDREHGGEVGVGPGIGLTVAEGLRTATLVEQRSRPVGGIWERRIDCEAA